MLNGQKNAITKAGWHETPAAQIVIKGSVALGPTQSVTHNVSRFSPFAGGGSKQTFSVSPWLQNIAIEANGETIWTTSAGAASGMVSSKNAESIESEVWKCEQEFYQLFEYVQFPERVLAPKYRNGFGVTRLTANGVIEADIDSLPEPATAVPFYPIPGLL